VLLIVYAVLAACGLELLARQLARRSLTVIIGRTEGPSFPALLGVAGLAAVVGMAFLWRRARRETGTAAKTTDGVVRLALVTAFVFGLAAQQHLGARIQSDGFFYFAYLRSLAFDHDVDLTNDYQMIGVGADRAMGSPTETGYAHTAWSIGPAVLWSPFFAVGHGVAHVLLAANVPMNVDGTSFPYRQSVCVGSLFYALLGLWFCYRLASRFFEAALAGWAAALVGLGSFILWYAVKEPTMSHALSMAAVSAFLWAWVATGDHRRGWQWALAGALAGVMMAVRWQNLVFLALPAIDVVVALVRGDRQSRAPLVAGVAVAGASAVVAFLPQALAWQAIYGSPLAVSPLSPKMFWTHPQLVLALWSSRNGLFATSPVAYVAAIGLVAFAWRERRFGIRALLLFILAAYVNSVVADWWGGAAYGARRFDGTIPLLVVGMAAALDLGRSWLARRPLAGVVSAFALLVVWNLTCMAAALDGAYYLSSPRSFGQVGAEQARVLHRWIGYPFSYPMNLLHAARYGVAPARWDQLAFVFLTDPAMGYGRVDVGNNDDVYLGGGWHAVEKAPDGRTSRWTTASAEMLLPLDHAAPLTVQLQLTPFMYPNAPAPQIRVLINGRVFGPFTLAPDWQRLDFPTEDAVWHSGVNRLQIEALTPASPARVGVSGDTRELGVAVDYIRLQVIK
jgi:hypothetical protein